MKYSLIACAITGALAINTNLIAQRDAATVTGILSEVKKDLEALDTTVKGYSGDQAPLLKASNDLITTLKDGKTKVDGSDELSLNDAVTLTTPVQDLTKSGETLTSDLKAFKPQVEKESMCTVVRTQVANVNDASQALIKSVIAKVPQEAQQIASQLVAGLTQVLEGAVSEFSEENCKDSGSTGGGSPSSSAAAPSSSAAGGESSSAAPTSAAPTGASSSAPPATTAAPSATGTGVATSSSGPVSTAPPVVAGAGAIAPLGAAAVAVAALLL